MLDRNAVRLCPHKRRVERRRIVETSHDLKDCIHCSDV